MRNKKSILIIDDDVSILRNISSILKDEFMVFTATSGDEGLNIFKTRAIDLIVLDLVLKEKPGIEVLREIRNISKTVPVIIITGYSAKERAEACAHLSTQGYIRKPFEIHYLLDTIRDALDRFNLHDRTCQKCLDQLLDIVKGSLGMEEREEDVTDITPERIQSLSPAVKKSIEFIKNNYSKQISVKDVAGFVCLSKKHFGEKFKKEVGVKLSRYINRYKIEKSKILLKDNMRIKLYSIATEVGFRNEQYFIKIFKHHTGMTPSEFRKNDRPPI